MQKLNVFILSAILILFTACSKDESAQNTNEGETAYANVTLTHSSGVRSSEGPGKEGSSEENYVKEVEIFIFNSNGTRDKHNDGYLAMSDWTSGSTYTIPVTAGSKTFLVAANAKLGKQEGMEISDLRALINNYELDNTNSRTIPVTDGIPMAGEATVFVGVDTHAIPVEIGISRALSKLKPLETKKPDVEVDLRDSDMKELFGDGTTSNLVKFELESYYVINGMSKSYTFAKYNNSNEQDDWKDWTLSTDIKNYFPSEYDNTGKPVKVYSGKSTAGDIWITTNTNTNVFVHENSPRDSIGTNTSVVGYDKKSICAMILKGKLTYNNDNTTTKTRYWRLNLAADYSYKLFRNVEYTVTLSSIRSKGYDTAEDAEDDNEGGEVVPKEGTSVSATILITPWRTIGLDQGV